MDGNSERSLRSVACYAQRSPLKLPEGTVVLPSISYEGYTDGQNMDLSDTRASGFTCSEREDGEPRGSILELSF